MNNAGRRKPSYCQSLHASPVESSALTTPPKRASPTLSYLLPERTERLDVGRHTVVRVVSTQDGAQPFTLFGDRRVKATAKFEVYLS
jgi:hypothetical protein